MPTELHDGRKLIAGNAPAEPRPKAGIFISTSNFNFNNVDMSGSNNSVGGSGVNQSINTTTSLGDRRLLIETLTSAGVMPAQVAELEAAAQADGPPTGSQPGPRVQEWLSRIGQTLTSPEAVRLVTAAVMLALGLPPGV